jgi:glutamate-ammonia-ligase adenylyltransferase
VRLRPDGAKGLLVSSLASFADYQRERAWTWEHQALVRARGIAGEASLLSAFDGVRSEVLSRTRDSAQLRADIVDMRRRMRAELDRSDAIRFDLKQGAGGLVDLEFLLQCLVLGEASRYPQLLSPRATPQLLRAACDAGLLGPRHCDELVAAHAALLEAGLSCTLDRRPRITAETPDISAARQAVTRACMVKALAFET